LIHLTSPGEHVQSLCPRNRSRLHVSVVVLARVLLSILLPSKVHSRLLYSPKYAISPFKETLPSPEPINEQAVQPPSSQVSPAKSIIQMTMDLASKVQEIRPHDLGQESLFSLRQVRKPSIRVSTVKFTALPVSIRLSSHPTPHCSL